MIHHHTPVSPSPNTPEYDLYLLVRGDRNLPIDHGYGLPYDGELPPLPQMSGKIITEDSLYSQDKA